MPAVAVSKSRFANRVEGLALSAVLTAMPTFAGAAMLMKLVGAQAIVGDTGGAAFFVVMTSLVSAVMASWLGPKYPRFFAATYEPLFFDASLSLKDKVTRWLARPTTAHQLVAVAMMLSVLGTALASL